VKQVKELARTIGMTQREHNLKEPVEQFVEQFKFGLVEVVYEWAKGKVNSSLYLFQVWMHFKFKMKYVI